MSEPAPPRWRRSVRLAFWLYVPTLFIATHWPKVVVPGPGGTDKVIHVVAFGLWASLLIGSLFFVKASSRWRNIAISIPLAIAYAGLDEGLQAIPAVKRVCAWDDFAANCTGVLLAGLGAVCIAVLRRGRAGHVRNDEDPPTSSTLP